MHTNSKSWFNCACLLLQVFRPRTPPEAIQVVSRLLEYIPSARISPLEACAHAFFDELREPNTRLPSGRELPVLFNFSPQGKDYDSKYRKKKVFSFNVQHNKDSGILHILTSREKFTYLYWTDSFLSVMALGPLSFT